MGAISSERAWSKCATERGKVHSTIQSSAQYSDAEGIGSSLLTLAMGAVECLSTEELTHLTCAITAWTVFQEWWWKVEVMVESTSTLPYSQCQSACNSTSPVHPLMNFKTIRDPILQQKFTSGGLSNTRNRSVSGLRQTLWLWPVISNLCTMALQMGVWGSRISRDIGGCEPLPSKRYALSNTGGVLWPF